MSYVIASDLFFFKELNTMPIIMFNDSREDIKYSWGTKRLYVHFCRIFWLETLNETIENNPDTTGVFSLQSLNRAHLSKLLS